MAEAAILLRLGWSWQEYMDAPDGVVLRMVRLLNAEVEAMKENRG